MIFGAQTKITKELIEDGICDVTERVNSDIMYGLSKELLEKYSKNIEKHYERDRGLYSYEMRMWAEPYEHYRARVRLVESMIYNSTISDVEKRTIMEVLTKDFNEIFNNSNSR